MCIRDRLYTHYCIESARISDYRSPRWWAFHRAVPTPAKSVVVGTVMGQINSFECLGYNVSYIRNNDVVKKLHKFNYMCGTIRRHLKSRRRNTSKVLKMMARCKLPYGSQDWTLTSTQASCCLLYTSILHCFDSINCLHLKLQTTHSICNITGMNNIIKRYVNKYNLKFLCC